MNYEVVMGLEVHVELATESKLFCSCSAKFGADANEHVCPACIGMPGYPPVTNKKAVELGITAGLVTNCEIARYVTFDKKNYYYPDLPAGYQITQLFNPICTNGFISIETSQGEKKIRIKQIHIEEDAGKLVHDDWTDSALVDYNRTSVPLVEIVSQPDFRSTEEVILYLEKLRALLTFSGVSDCKLEEGSMRADINISVREKGKDTLGTRTEMKNMNSLKAIARAIEYESQRHMDALETGVETLVQETRRWDESKNQSFSMRNKENATDYRYFPNAELPPIVINEEWIEKVKRSLPELAHEKAERYAQQFELPDQDIQILITSRALTEIFDEIMKHCDKPKEAANWLLVELMNLVKLEKVSIDDVLMDGKKIAALICLVEQKVINRTTAKEIFSEIYRNDVDPDAYVKEHGLSMVTDENLLLETVKAALAENPKSVAEYRDGNQKVIGFFVGMVMKKMSGKADPTMVNTILKKLLEEA